MALLSPNRRPSSKAQAPPRGVREASPSYFGLNVDSGAGTVSSSGGRNVKQALSSSSVGIRSAAESPLHTLPFHSTTSDFDAFKREVDRRSRGVKLDRTAATTSPRAGPGSGVRGRGATAATTPAAAPASPPSPSLTAFEKSASGGSPPPPPVAAPETPLRSIDLARAKAETIAKLDLEPVNRSPKRLYTEDAVESVFDRDRTRGASLSASHRPASGAASSRTDSPPHEQKLRRLEGSHSVSHTDLLHHGGGGSGGGEPSLPRAATLPETLEHEAPSMISARTAANMLQTSGDMVLLLDLRVYNSYHHSHVAGALNLCVPTTLIKRPSYNVHRLADTFTDPEQRAKFEQWRSCKTIVVYDGSTAHMSDAGNAVHILKKFAAEGWRGGSRIVRGGFDEFAKACPELVEAGSPPGQGGHGQRQGGQPKRAMPALKLDLHGHGRQQQPARPSDALAPVLGGCPLPANEGVANPFFNNIRQNTDLIGGVGQMPVHLPPALTAEQRERLPRWVQRAAEAEDEGKAVSDTFLQIEVKELKRMQQALSSEVTYGTPAAGEEQKVRIAGIEKGAKNRYNNIWPFEHTRVKLEGVPSHACDYVNANFISTSLSRKRYIATQGPTPATFDDFWTMVWQRDVRVVVMLTAMVEGGLVKAHDYWSGRHYGNFKVTLLSERRVSVEPRRVRRHRQNNGGRPGPGLAKSDGSRHSSYSTSADGDGKADEKADGQPFVVVRKMTVMNEQEPWARLREITQLHYSNWPDFGAPAQPGHLIGLVDQCDAVIRNSNGDPNRPVVVHCSAGCGRTGTFCTVDSVVDALREQGRNADSDSSSAEDSDPVRKKRDSTIMDVGDDASATSDPGDASRVHWQDTDLIERTVNQLRVQRLSMVQSLRQFVLCYEAVAEWLVMQMQEDGLT